MLVDGDCVCVCAAAAHVHLHHPCGNRCMFLYVV